MIDLLVVHRPVGGGHRAAFERIADVRAPAAGEPLRVLVTSGGFGVGPIEKVVASFAGIEAIGGRGRFPGARSRVATRFDAVRDRFGACESLCHALLNRVTHATPARPGVGAYDRLRP
jgi:hypothetical protein